MRRDLELDSILSSKQGLANSKQEKFRDLGKNYTRSAKLLDSKSPTRSKYENFDFNHRDLGLESINIKDLLGYCRNLESNVVRLKEENEKVEEANFDLRKRLKEATLDVKKIQNETIKPFELQQNAKEDKILRYQEKINKTKLKLNQALVENKKISKELEDAKRKEKGLTELCKNQVSEISEEFACKFKASSKRFNEDIARMKEKFCLEMKEFDDENLNLRKQIVEQETRWSREVEGRDREIDRRDEEIEKRNKVIENRNKEIEAKIEEIKCANRDLDRKSKEMEVLKEKLDECARMQSKMMQEFDTLQSQSRNRYETEIESLKRKITQLEEENKIRIDMNDKLNQELQYLSKTISTLRNELEQKKLESVSTLHKNLSPDHLTTHNLSLQTKINSLESTNRSLLIEQENLKESIKTLEKTLKSATSTHENQTNEINKLNKLITESKTIHEKEINELRQHFIVETLQRTKDFENELENKTQYFEMEIDQKNEEFQSMLQEAQRYYKMNEEKNNKILLLEEEIKKSEKTIEKFQGFHKNYRKFKSSFEIQINKFRNFCNIFKNYVKQNFDQFGKIFNENSLDLIKIIELNLLDKDNKKKIVLEKMRKDYEGVMAKFENAQNHVFALENESEVLKQKVFHLENEISDKRSEFNNEEVDKKELNFSIQKIIESVEVLDQESYQNYQFYESSLIDLKVEFQKEIHANNQKYLKIINDLEEQLEHLKAKINHIGSQKTAENNEYNSNLQILNQELIKTLQDLRN